MDSARTGKWYAAEVRCHTLLYAAFYAEVVHDGYVCSHACPELALHTQHVTAGCAFALYNSPTAALETVTLVQLAPQLTLTFTPEPLGMLFALVAGSLWPLASLYTIGYMRGAGEKNHTRFMLSLIHI